MQMPCTSSESARMKAGRLQAGHSYLSLWESYEANPPGDHFQAHGGQKCDLPRVNHA